MYSKAKNKPSIHIQKELPLQTQIFQYQNMMFITWFKYLVSAVMYSWTL
jgi:hypothetical protein